MMNFGSSCDGKTVKDDVFWNRRLFLFRCLLAVASSLVAFALAEIACRLLIPEQASVRFQQDVDELQGLKLDEAARMVRNDPELFWKLAPDTRIPDDAWPFFGVTVRTRLR